MKFLTFSELSLLLDFNRALSFIDEIASDHYFAGSYSKFIHNSLSHFSVTIRSYENHSGHF